MNKPVLPLLFAVGLAVSPTIHSWADGPAEAWTNARNSPSLILKQVPGTVILVNGWGNHVIELGLPQIGEFKKIAATYESWVKTAKENGVTNFSKPIGTIGKNTVTFRVFDDEGMLLFPDATPLSLEQVKKFAELLDKEVPELQKRIETIDKLFK